MTKLFLVLLANCVIIAPVFLAGAFAGQADSTVTYVALFGGALGWQTLLGHWLSSD